MNNINLNLYRYFLEVAKYESFSKAANSLMISQPSLSYSIKVLEEQLNKQLFIRNNHKISLTNDGLEIFNKLKNIFAELDSITNNNLLSGKVILGVRSAYASYILPFYINELNKIYPDLKIEFFIAKSNNLLKMLNNQEIDIMIDEDKYFGEYESNETYPFENILFTTNEKYNELNFAVTIDYFKENILYLTKNNKISNIFIEKYHDIKVEILESTPIMVNKIKNDNSIGLVPKMLLMNDLASGNLKELKTDIEIPNSYMYTTYLKKLENKKIKAVVDFFKEYKYF
mgnify:CR=1 FL=1